MENKEDIIARLRLLLMATRAGSSIVDMELNEAQDKVTIIFKGGKKEVNIAADSGIAIIRDVINSI